MLYVYAITDSPVPPLVAGLQGAPVEVAGEDGLFAIWSEHEDSRLEADETALWEHERVVEALLDSGAVLPMRFGSWVRDREALRGVLEERRGELGLGLDRVRGAVEIGVRAMVRAAPAGLPHAAPESGRPGTSYMLTRLNDEKRSAALAARIHEPLAALSRASTARRTSLAGPVNTAYLVDRDEVEPFRAAVQNLDDSLGEGTVVCTGPWPPYSFTPSEARR